MVQSNSAPLEPLPLHLLLKRREVGKLLAKFKTLLLGIDLALLRADGRLFVSTDEWTATSTDQVAWVQRLAQAGEAQQIQIAEVSLLPLWLQSQLVGVLAARGVVLGAFDDIPLEERQIEVAPGDLLVFYTDGVTEAMNAAGQMFGEERLQTTITANVEGSAEQVCQAVLKALEIFTEDTPPSDDITLLVVKRQHIITV